MYKGIYQANGKLAQLHLNRFNSIPYDFLDDEVLLDTCSARAEDGLGRLKPRSRNDDYSGFLVLTSKNLFYKDFKGTVLIPLDDIKSASTYAFGAIGTTGLKLILKSGHTLSISGVSGFVKKFQKEFVSGSIPWNSR